MTGMTPVGYETNLRRSPVSRLADRPLVGVPIAARFRLLPLAAQLFTESDTGCVEVSCSVEVHISKINLKEQAEQRIPLASGPKKSNACYFRLISLTAHGASATFPCTFPASLSRMGGMA